MRIESHIQSIAEKRHQIKEQIAAEAARPCPDFMLIGRLKKQNLHLKEEMQHCFKLLKTQQGNVS